MPTLKRANLSCGAAGQQQRFGTSTDYTLKNDHPADKQQGCKPCPALHFNKKFPKSNRLRELVVKSWLAKSSVR
jgi:hypothetical protein